jgi:iron complex outermembrane recepter protein
MNSLSDSAFRLLRRVALLVFLPVVVFAAEPVRRSFDISAGDAEETLRHFASQSAMQVAFPPDAVRGVRTRSVRGELTAREALGVMTEGTKLLVVEDLATGALSVRRETSVEVAEKKGESRPTRSRTAARDADGRVQLQDYEVIGTKIDGLNNRSLLPAHEEAALPYQVYTRVEIEQMGVMNMEEFFGRLPQSVNYGTNSQQQVLFSGAVGAQQYSVSAVDMGFGSDQTVVLVNGRRLGQGSPFAGPDISRIPVGTIERVEILPAASAAIYGGGAVGGAINIILRKDYDVRELTTYVGTSTNGGGTSIRLSYIDGRSFNNGRTKLTTTLDYTDKQGVRQGQRNFLRRALDKYGPEDTQYQVGGASLFEGAMLGVFGTHPGTIVLATPDGGLGIPGNPTARYAGIPSGLTPTQANALTPASFTATAGTPNLGGRHDRAYLIRPMTNYSVGLQLEHEILSGDRLNFYSEAQLAYQPTSISYPQSFNLTLPANHPYNPFRTGVTPGFAGSPVRVYFDFPDIDDPDTAQERHDARVTLGLKGKLRDNWEWSLDASGQYQRLFADSNNPSNYFQLLLNTVTRPGAAPLDQRWEMWNPFADHTVHPVSREHHDRYFIYNRTSSYYNRNSQLALRLLGNVWELPAGPIRLSAGGDLRANQYNTYNKVTDSPELRAIAAATEFNAATTSNRSETTRSAFVETTFPIFSKNWRPVGVESFEVGLSRRWQESNRGRNTISSTISGNVWLIKDLMVRASLTDGFNSLSQEDIADPLIQENLLTSINDPLRGSVNRQVTIPVRVIGGNPLLRTPSAHSLNYGVVVKPRFVPGLTLNINYTLTERVDTVATPSVSDILTFPQDHPGRLERAPLTPDDIALGYTGGAIIRLDTTRINLAFRSMETFNYSVNYRVPIPREYGKLTWNTTATHLNAQRTRTRPTGVELNHAGTRNALKWRGNSSLFWTDDRWSAGVTGYYVNSYYDIHTMPTPVFPTATGIDGRKIKHTLLFDLRGGYRFPAGDLGERGWKSMLSGTTINVGVQNVMNKMGPLVTDFQGWYSRFSDPMLRFVYVEVKKSF